MAYRLILAFIIIAWILFSCKDKQEQLPNVVLQRAAIGSQELSLIGDPNENLPIDRNITLTFSLPIDPNTVNDAISLKEGQQTINSNTTLSSENKVVTLSPIGGLNNSTFYTIAINAQLKGARGENFVAQNISFLTMVGDLTLVVADIGGVAVGSDPIVKDVPLELDMNFEFSAPVQQQSFIDAFGFTGPTSPSLNITFSNEDKNVNVTGSPSLLYWAKYGFSISNELKGATGGSYAGISKSIYTKLDSSLKFPEISDEELLTKAQEFTFKYFWDFAHPNSGLTRERNTSGDLVTIGGSGFGVMTILVGIERGFITREQGVTRLAKIVDFLTNADRFHGVWPHWMNGNTGATIPFSQDDDGGDIVETAFMIQGLLTVSEYLDANQPDEKAIIDKINILWEEVEWDWYTQGENSITWHWSPNIGFQKNLKVRGWNEALIVYVLAAASQTHAINKEVYDEGWARNGGMINNKSFYGITLPLGEDYGGPMFFEHYSFLGIDPRNLSDAYANYWDQVRSHTLINRAHCISNPGNYLGYSEQSWGLTASDNHQGYAAHSPTNDLGVLTPTAALSSLPFTPNESMAALRQFYFILGDRLWGNYGFYDAFNFTENWVASSFLAIDQGPIIIMIENHRTALLWELFMSNSDVKSGLDKLNFNY